jgi:hypothetical protein
MPAAASALSVAFGVLLILVMLQDAFETVVLPRRVQRPVSLGRYFLFLTWLPGKAAAHKFKKPSRREAFLAYFGPLELIGLLIVWVIGCIIGYGLVYRGIAPSQGFGDQLFFSGSTFTTVGIATLPASTGLIRAIAVGESGTGLAFVALIVAYLPSLQQSFSRRESQLAMLDEWAGSPPAAGELLRRLGGSSELTVVSFFEQWERWAAEVLESHLSYSVLAFFRSQHGNQSWVAGLATILDSASVICAAGAPDVIAWPAFRAFAMARHAAVDICQVVGAAPRPPRPGHWRDDGMEEALGAAEPWLSASRVDFVERMRQQRELYEPYLAALSEHLLMALPPFGPPPGAAAAWQLTAWDRAPGLQLRRRRP